MKLTIQSPGKLMISGEWSILEPGNPALVGAFDRYVYCDYEDADEYIVNMPDIQLTNLHGSYENRTFQFREQLDDAAKARGEIARRSIEVALNYLTEEGKILKPFSVSTDSVEHTITIADGTQQKTGLGTSAAVTTALIGTLLKINGYDLARRATTMLIFKLALIAHYLAQGQLGSGFDIAACCFGGVNLYQRFDESWLRDQLKGQKTLHDTVTPEWPGLVIEKIPLPPEMQLFAAWTGKAASTTEMIRAMQEFKTRDAKNYSELITMLSRTTSTLVEALKSANQPHILNLLEANRLCLHKLGELSSLQIETPELAKLSDIAKQHGGGAKPSGAGGGDCGIGICFDQFVKEDIEWAWEEAGLYPLDVFVSERGVSVWY